MIISTVTVMDIAFYPRQVGLYNYRHNYATINITVA